MPAEARVTSIWKMQRLFLVILFIGPAGYFVFDGKIGYPRSNERWLLHAQLEKEGRESEWPAAAASRGWTDKVPHKFFGPGDILMQFVCAGLFGALGVVALGYWISQKDRVLKSEEGAVIEPTGKRIPFESITGLGKKNWAKKGLATVRYELDGRQGKFVLDDYKFDAKPTHAILEEIEQYLLAQNAEPEKNLPAS